MKPSSKSKDKVTSKRGKTSSKKDMAMMAMLLDQLKQWNVNNDNEDGKTSPRRKRGRKPKLKEKEHGIMLILKALNQQSPI